MASGVDARMLKSTKFPAEFNKKVDMQKVNLQVMKKWIAGKISEILGNEDDVVIELCFNLIEGPRYPDIKALQIQLTGFLDKDTAPFCKELWKLLLSGQDSPQGVPKELLEAKKLELLQEKRDADKAAEDARSRRQDHERRDRELADLKERDRRDRPNDRGNFGQGRRGDHAFERRGRGGNPRPNRRSRSPDQRSRPTRDSYGRDSYVPSDRGRRTQRGQGRRRTRSVSESRSRSRSASRSSSISRSPSRRSRTERGVDVKKRSRSPRGDAYRPGRGDRNGRGRRGVSRQSRSVSSGRWSRSPKRRRYSSSRSRSVERRRRRSTESSRSRSRSESRSRSRSRSHSRRGGSSPHDNRQSRRHREQSAVSDDGARPQDRGNAARQEKGRPRGGQSTGRRRNSSSASSRSPSPGK